MSSALGTWELITKTHENPRLVLTLANGHKVCFPLPADHPMVQGIRSAEKMKQEPA
jgi:hypothetical protein